MTMNLKVKVGAGVGALALAGATMAQGTGGSIDVSSITTLCTEAAAAVATIGLAVLAVHYGAKVYRWIRSAG
jgi:hypothetical protein